MTVISGILYYYKLSLLDLVYRLNNNELIE